MHRNYIYIYIDRYINIKTIYIILHINVVLLSSQKHTYTKKEAPPNTYTSQYIYHTIWSYVTHLYTWTYQLSI